jgi:hypothetical protein
MKSFIIWPVSKLVIQWDIRPYLIRPIGRHSCSHTILETSWATANQAVPLESVVILHMLCKLCQRIARRRALRSA